MHVCALRAGYRAKKTPLHSLSGLENLHIHEVNIGHLLETSGEFSTCNWLVI